MPLTLAEHERKIINYTEHVAGGQNHPLLQARLVMALADYFDSPLPHPSSLRLPAAGDICGKQNKRKLLNTVIVLCYHGAARRRRECDKGKKGGNVEWSDEHMEEKKKHKTKGR